MRVLLCQTKTGVLSIPTQNSPSYFILSKCQRLPPPGHKGKTPYSRGGDGQATLLSMLREYVISEAMFSCCAILLTALIFFERAFRHILSFVVANVVRIKNGKARVGILGLNLSSHICLAAVLFIFAHDTTSISLIFTCLF